ncbi:MAG: cyclic pyranopterin monophosphate synthase MoaC [Zavarzinella sp.]
MSQLSHFDESGASRMVDISAKASTARVAVASGVIIMAPTTLEMIQLRQFSKGDVCEVARLAGIMAAKQTSQIIPLCHPILLSGITVDFEVELPDRLKILATVKTSGQTGVEMEALTAVSAAGLTVYDMCKSVDRSMVISQIQLETKTGGKSGDYHRDTEQK